MPREMRYEIFTEGMGVLSGAFPGWYDETVRATWWHCFHMMDEKVFLAAVLEVTKQDYKPKTSLIYKYEEQVKKQRGSGLDRETIRELQRFAEGFGIHVGEALTMVYWEYGWLWKRIPPECVEDVKALFTLHADQDERRQYLDSIQEKSQTPRQWPEGKLASTKAQNEAEPKQVGAAMDDRLPF